MHDFNGSDVEVLISDRKVWVNVDGACALRAQDCRTLIVDGNPTRVPVYMVPTGRLFRHNDDVYLKLTPDPKSEEREPVRRLGSFQGADYTISGVGDDTVFAYDTIVTLIKLGL